MNNGENTFGPSALIRRLLVEWVGVIGIALVIAIVVRMFLLQQFYISGPSMETTMFTNNRVLVNKFAYQIGDVKRGDVVVFDRATVNGNDVVHDDLIKRVIALGGETISIKACIVYINGAILAEPYLPARDTEMTDPQDRCSTVDIVDTVIPQGEFFLMGDNRPQSFDSRMFGPITREMIVGRAFVIIWPVTQWHFL